MDRHNGSGAGHLVEVRNVGKVYPDGTRALKGVSFGVPGGEFAVVVGRSGAGKSTLLRCINALVEPTEGEVLVGGGLTTGLGKGEQRAIRRDVGFIFQQFNLVRRVSALQNVLCGRLADAPVLTSCLRRFSKDDRLAAMECLERVGLAEKAGQRADTLSGGQQQRVSIARALAQRPKVVLADEPVASLDPESARVVMDTLRSLSKEEGIAVICNLHQVNLAADYADSIIGIREGELVLAGRAGELSKEQIESVYGGRREKREVA